MDKVFLSRDSYSDDNLYQSIKLELESYDLEVVEWNQAYDTGYNQDKANECDTLIIVPSYTYNNGTDCLWVSERQYHLATEFEICRTPNDIIVPLIEKSGGLKFYMAESIGNTAWSYTDERYGCLDMEHYRGFAQTYTFGDVGFTLKPEPDYSVGSASKPSIGVKPILAAYLLQKSANTIY